MKEMPFSAAALIAFLSIPRVSHSKGLPSGSEMSQYMRTTLTIGHGNVSVFFTEFDSLFFLILTVVFSIFLPMLNMNIEFRNGRMRHSIRYAPLNVGLIYKGHGVQDMLEEWCERSADNLGGHSLGATALMGRKEGA